MLYLLFLIWPFAELWAFIAMGSRIGAGHVILEIFLSAGLGLLVLRVHGLRAFNTIQADLAQWAMPTEILLDDFLVFAAGVLLMIPGFISDALGVVLLVPPTRWLVRRFLLWKGEDLLRGANIQGFTVGKHRDRTIIDVKAKGRDGPLGA